MHEISITMRDLFSINSFGGGVRKAREACFSFVIECVFVDILRLPFSFSFRQLVFHSVNFSVLLFFMVLLLFFFGSSVLRSVYAAVMILVAEIRVRISKEWKNTVRKAISTTRTRRKHTKNDVNQTAFCFGHIFLWHLRCARTRRLIWRRC